VEIKQQVGETAGKVWHLLDEGGPQTLAQIKKRFNGSSEDKVEISQNKKTFTVALR
jgi:hypothetical protein